MAMNIAAAEEKAFQGAKAAIRSIINDEGAIDHDQALRAIVGNVTRAVLGEIISNAEVLVIGGSSSGSHKVV